MNPPSEIQTLVAKFVDEMTALAKREALRQVSAAFRVGTPKAPAASSASRGGKRSPAQLAELQQRALEHIAAHPGVRIEQINAAIGTSTKELALPLRQLVAEGAIRTEGERRGTKYYDSGKAQKAQRSAKQRAAAA